MDRPRLIRGLRIAWSVVFGILCVLLVVMWGRSFAARDMIRGVIGNNGLHLNATSLRGDVAIAFDQWRGSPHPWIFESVSDQRNMTGVFSSVTGKPPLSLLGFRYLFQPNLTVLVLPYWALALVPVLLASAPWIEWKFSLRTLLIATTLIAVVLGLVVIMRL
jgi:hypothetical protein